MKKPFVCWSITLLCVAFMFSSCGKNEELEPEIPANPVTGVAFDRKEIKIVVGDTRALTASIIPADATNKGVRMTSDNPEVLTAEKGYIKGVKAGTATVTITTVDGAKTDNCIVTVMETATYYAVGDLYPDANAPAGVVFWLDPETTNARGQGYEGRVVSLDEEDKLKWGESGVATVATDEEYGYANTLVIKAIKDWADDYSAFKWCDDKNTEGHQGWYLPALGELNNLHKSMETVNGTLRVMDATMISPAFYWASTEREESPRYAAKGFDFGAGEESWYSKDNVTCKTRAVCSF